ncbi:MAG TPA: glycosyltransferase family A protein [Solirubrobacteraceae bacterium]|jgi:cellulose synthase/poly-beta-1,6-N-acetylglucosamine synthase-like glycosyltransferase|nr:glycosyltransferase family A protein [Solirubrobacteraceae bacterium]
MSPELQLGPLRVSAPASTASPASAGGEPSLSVVIPYYRGAAVIAEAVESVLAQTLAPLEIVICDDGSPDDLDAALGGLRERVVVVRQENGGIASAMNATTRAARGEFVVQLDQDDAFLPGRLEAIAAVLRARPDLDIVATDAIVEMQGREIVTLEAISRYEDGDQRAAMLRTCSFLWPAIRRSRLLAAGGYDESFAVMQDWECFARLVLGGALVAYVHAPLYRWRMTPGSRSSRDRVANVEAIERMLVKLLAGSSLRDSERARAQALLSQRRRWLARERARQAVENRSPSARRLSLGLAAGRGFDNATRAKAAVTVLSPALARRFLERRAEQADPAREALAQRGFHWAAEADGS